ncbi:hypothetical protein G9470_21070 [Bacteroides xylanolyticus]|uniref:Uncharacterized protein n=1 Tax=Lacrimispora defluvii TaxID=2719233 RepID=A0ABX1VVY4_9FIRM|nr:hypothetical protein [Lacrimispora defluvii]
MPIIYTEIKESESGVICVKRKGKWGIFELSESNEEQPDMGC